MELIRICDAEEFVVDYDKSRGMYRFSLFDNGHFIDEFWFDQANEVREKSQSVKNMIKVVKKLEAANGLNYAYINSFETPHFVGIYSDVEDEYLLFAKDGCVFTMYHLGLPDFLEELDDIVYSLVEEHITHVSESTSYSLRIVEAEQDV